MNIDLNIFLWFSIRSDCAATNALLSNSIGMDLSAETNNPQHRPALDYISTHLRIGKFASSDHEEKVKICVFKLKIKLISGYLFLCSIQRIRRLL